MTTYSKITVDSINPEGFKGLPVAQLRQTITRSLPKVQVTSSLKKSIYSDAELDITSNDYVETRVSWMEVKKGATVESVQADLDKFPKAKLIRFLASSIILDDNQARVAKQGLSNTDTSKSLDSFNEKYGFPAGTAWSTEHLAFFLNNIADRQVVRKGGEGADKDEIVMFNGKQQFRRIELDPDGGEDVDNRITEEVKVQKEIVMAPANTTSKVAA